MLHHIFGRWDDRSTFAFGLMASLPSFDAVYHALGAVAIVVSIYCSLDRNHRERRAAAKAEGR